MSKGRRAAVVAPGEERTSVDMGGIGLGSLLPGATWAVVADRARAQPG